jgi:hypothetical protein
MEPNDKPTEQTPGGISRRDFIRRASKEAVTTGTKLVPGAALASKALGIDNGNATTPDGQPVKRGLLQRFADWRGNRNKTTEND